MRIVLEGCDGTGKTTLAKILADKYKLDICHCTQHDPNDYDFYKQSIRKNNIVWDRHVIGELIYPEIFGRKSNMSGESARLIICYGRELDTKFFTISTDINMIKNRLAARNDEYSFILDNIETIHDQFLFWSDQFNIPVIDPSKMTLSEIFDTIEADQPMQTFIHK